MEIKSRGNPRRVVGAFEYELEKISGSRFLTRLIPAEDVASVLSEQAQLRVLHPHCRHVCFAYVGRTQEDIRLSDDGEPSKTAGFPMLKVLLGHHLRFSAALVTRYFGGTKLGTGGLVRAYTAAVRESLALCQLEELRPLLSFQVRCQYDQEPLVRHTLAKYQGTITNVSYSETVLVEATAEKSTWPQLHSVLDAQRGIKARAL